MNALLSIKAPNPISINPNEMIKPPTFRPVNGIPGVGGESSVNCGVNGFDASSI